MLFYTYTNINMYHVYSVASSRPIISRIEFVFRIFFSTKHCKYLAFSKSKVNQFFDTRNTNGIFIQIKVCKQTMWRKLFNFYFNLNVKSIFRYYFDSKANLSVRLLKSRHLGWDLFLAAKQKFVVFLHLFNLCIKCIQKKNVRFSCSNTDLNCNNV